MEFRGGGDYLAADRQSLPHCEKEEICYASDIKHHFKSIKKGFTLAEVMITLGIIGVVAALTIPMLVASYQKIVLKNQFKKTYSVLSQNLLKSQLDYGNIPGCYYYSSGCLPHKCVEYNDDGTCKRYEMSDGSPLVSDVCGPTSDCKDFTDIFIKNLKTIKICDRNAYSKGCLGYIKGADEIKKESNPDLSDEEINKLVAGSYAGFYGNVIRNKSIAYVLPDGQVLFSSSYPFSTRVFAVDVNGIKPPNKWGYDVFSFITSGDTNSGMRLKGQALIEKGGTSGNDMIINMGK